MCAVSTYKCAYICLFVCIQIAGFEMKSVKIFRHEENLHNFVVLYLRRPIVGASAVLGADANSDADADNRNRDVKALQSLLADACNKFVIFEQTPKKITITATTTATKKKIQQ
uniref:Uncharacterized protein n=1 Tax=Ceratitis capitata TaxID=7213 RepID=W8B3W1_CERCA